ncbi:MAG TPA: hypothetical protein VG186_18275 [Solirubrobacteraceae bacterium]|nr:hypothetical protein [Solirubrobacteraceae bacterium]
MPVAAATAASVGVLGLVTLAGGVVLWSRFVEMGLPADQAVAVVPAPVLVATGAEFLLPAFGAAALTVLVLVLIRSNRLGSPLWPFAFGAVVAIAEIVFAIVPLKPFSLALALIAVVDGIIILACFRNEKVIGGVGGVALISFLAIGAFWLGRAYARTANYPMVVPMAYSRTEPGSPVRIETGYFVAETSDRIWFASLPQSLPGQPNELREFPRSETEDLEIGSLQAPAQAHRVALLFAANLCQRVISLEAARSTEKHKKPVKFIPNGCTVPRPKRR